MSVQIHLLSVYGGFGNVDLAEPRQNGAQQLVFVLHHDEEPRGVIEELNAPAQRRLRIRGQLIRIQQHHALEYLPVLQVHVRFGKELQILANEADALAVRAIHMHDVILHGCLVVAVNAADEIPRDAVFSASRHAVKYDVGDFLLRNEVLQLLLDVAMNVQHIDYGPGHGHGFLDDANARFLGCCKFGHLHLRENGNNKAARNE